MMKFRRDVIVGRGGQGILAGRADTFHARVICPQDERIAPTLRGALRDEFRRIRRPPYGVLWCVGINFVLVTTFWFVPWPVVKDFMFNLHRTFWFPIVMASWLIADVPATNELAPDRWRVLAALDDEAAIDRLLRAKHLALWLITTPITVADTPTLRA